MKRIGILIGWLVWAAGVSAQSWSLDDCMKYAEEHATEEAGGGKRPPAQAGLPACCGRIPAYRYGRRAGTVCLGTKHRPGNQYL